MLLNELIYDFRASHFLFSLILNMATLKCQQRGSGPPKYGNNLQYTPQADKIQKKKFASKTLIEKPRDEVIIEIEEDKENPIDQRETEPPGENNNLQQIFSNNINNYNNGKVFCSSFWMIVRLFQ